MKLLAVLGLIAILVPPTEFGAMPKVKAPLVRGRYQSAAGTRTVSESPRDLANSLHHCP